MQQLNLALSYKVNMKLPFWATAFTFCICLGTTSLFAQHDLHAFCGTEDEGLERLQDNIAAAKAYAKTHPHQKGMITYVPVRFKVIGRTDGTGEATVHATLDLLEAMNRDFAPYDILFYLEDVDGTPFDYYYSDNYYNSLSNSPNFMTSVRSDSAITNLYSQ